VLVIRHDVLPVHFGGADAAQLADFGQLLVAAEVVANTTVTNYGLAGVLGFLHQDGDGNRRPAAKAKNISRFSLA